MSGSNKPQPQQLLTPDPNASKHLQEQNRERMQILEGDQASPNGGGQGGVLNRLIDSKSDQVEQNILAELKNDKSGGGNLFGSIGNMYGGQGQSPDGFEEIKKNDVI